MLALQTRYIFLYGFPISLGITFPFPFCNTQIVFYTSICQYCEYSKCLLPAFTHAFNLLGLVQYLTVPNNFLNTGTTNGLVPSNFWQRT